ncbi:MAG TPA: hypothetical protein VG328_20905 [Stellaceae bacterium]|jgi:hypothetical protein|nr:hypothetical protein [Stellaceae bacterium]
MGIGTSNLPAEHRVLVRTGEEDLVMPTGSHKQAQKQAMKRARQTTHRMQETRQLRRATRRERMSAGNPKPGDILVDLDFHAAPDDIQAEEIEIDPQLDESETAEP